MKENKLTEKIYLRECSKCGKIRETRQLNIRHQDFQKTYRKRPWDTKPRSRFWFMHTKNYSLCKVCMPKIIKLLEIK